MIWTDSPLKTSRKLHHTHARTQPPLAEGSRAFVKDLKTLKAEMQENTETEKGSRHVRSFGLMTEYVAVKKILINKSIIYIHIH